jgi:hypothetical protein
MFNQAFKLLSLTIVLISLPVWGADQKETYPIVDTGQTRCYSNKAEISFPRKGNAFYGQDAQYQINHPSYTDNKDSTVTDNVTGLMWQKSMGEKMTYEGAFQKVKECNLGGYHDWRIPTIKELYSLILFTGRVQGQKAITPFIDTKYFDQPLGNSQAGEREIDAQTWSSTEYVGRTMRNDETIFGVNFIDGRIKGYPKYDPRTYSPNRMYFRFVRGNSNYGKNRFIDNGNGTVTDAATGLMWQKSDGGRGMDWQKALKYADSLKLGGYTDWRLPNAKELQSIVDYTRSPQTTNSPAIDPIFKTTPIRDPAGKKQYPFFWTGTTHLDGKNPYASAAYLAFGEAQGKMHNRLMDVHGAGAQRSDPKSGNQKDYPQYFGPQGDIRYVFNYVRCVRGGKVKLITSGKRNTETTTGLHSGNQKSTSRFIRRLDKNGDGKVSKDEFDGPKQHFSDWDKNRDGFISQDEAPNGPPPRR